MVHLTAQYPLCSRIANNPKGMVNRLVWQHFRSAQQAFWMVLTAYLTLYYLSA